MENPGAFLLSRIERNNVRLLSGGFIRIFALAINLLQSVSSFLFSQGPGVDIEQNYAARHASGTDLLRLQGIPRHGSRRAIRIHHQPRR